MEFPQRMYGVIGITKTVQFSMTIGALGLLSMLEIEGLTLPEYLITIQHLSLPIVTVLFIMCAKYSLFSFSIVGLQIAYVTVIIIWTGSAIGVTVFFILQCSFIPISKRTFVLVFTLATILVTLIEICFYLGIIRYRRKEYKRQLAEFSLPDESLFKASDDTDDQDRKMITDPSFSENYSSEDIRSSKRQEKTLKYKQCLLMDDFDLSPSSKLSINDKCTQTGWINVPGSLELISALTSSYCKVDNDEELFNEIAQKCDRPSTSNSSKPQLMMKQVIIKNGENSKKCLRGTAEIIVSQITKDAERVINILPKVQKH